MLPMRQSTMNFKSVEHAIPTSYESAIATSLTWDLAWGKMMRGRFFDIMAVFTNARRSFDVLLTEFEWNFGV